MVRYNEQLSVRVNMPLKNDVNEICEKYAVNESCVVRHALVRFIDNLNSTPEQSKHLFV
jgi:hypothetical protein